MEDQSTAMLASRKDDPDPDGDLQLVIGTEDQQRSIRVSSKVLSLASPVLAAMFSPKFAEGRALSELNPVAVPTVNFPDDDPEAMVWLCEAFHFKRPVAVGLHFSLVKAIALLCDKYDMSKALSPWSELWMNFWKGSTDGPDEYPQMLWISYAFDNHARFYVICTSLVQLYTEHDLASTGDRLTGNIVPDRILESLNALRHSILDLLEAELEDLVTIHLRHMCKSAADHEERLRPCEHLSRTGHFFQELQRLRLWPICRMLQITNLSTILNQLNDFRPYYGDKDNDEDIERCRQHRIHSSCSSPALNFKNTLETSVQDLPDLLGLCLACVKHGKITEQEKNCNASSLHSHDFQEFHGYRPDYD